MGTVIISVRRVVASVLVTAPRRTVPYGSTLRLTASAHDPLGHRIDEVNAFSFSSSDPRSIRVSSDGVATAMFGLGPPSVTRVSADLTADGRIVRGFVDISPGPPDVFDHAALMLSEYEVPPAAPTLGQGAAFLARQGNVIAYTVAWSTVSSPVAGLSLRGPATAEAIGDVLVEIPVIDQTSTYGSVAGAFGAVEVLGDGMTLDSLTSLMDRGEAYVELRTGAFPHGEVRGQVAAVIR